MNKSITPLTNQPSQAIQQMASPIDRQAVVTRHAITFTQPNPAEILQVGNGEIAFGIDITGLQSLYGNTFSQWGWHTPVALGWVPLTGQVQDSGLKVLAVDGVLPTPYAVSQGTYRIRWPVRGLLSNNASAETKAFFKWLGAPQAALAMSKHSVFAPALSRRRATLAPPRP